MTIRGYDRLTENDVWAWVRPQQLIKTQCSNHNSVLDFVFATEEVKSWPVSTEIFPPDPTYCPDTSSTSDHRLVLATFEIPSDGDPDVKTQLLESITRIEDELNDLKTTVEQLPSQ